MRNANLYGEADSSSLLEYGRLESMNNQSLADAYEVVRVHLSGPNGLMSQVEQGLGVDEAHVQELEHVLERIALEWRNISAIPKQIAQLFCNLFPRLENCIHLYPSSEPELSNLYNCSVYNCCRDGNRQITGTGHCQTPHQTATLRYMMNDSSLRYEQGSGRHAALSHASPCSGHCKVFARDCKFLCRQCDYTKQHTMERVSLQ